MTVNMSSSKTLITGVKSSGLLCMKNEQLELMRGTLDDAIDPLMTEAPRSETLTS